MEKISLAEKFALVHEHWSPKVVADLNGQQVKVVKLKGDFIWHHHDAEDELFLVVRGELRMDFRDHFEIIRAGEFIVVPRGVEHKPSCDEEVELVLFEPISTLNTGNVKNERTVPQPQHI